MLKILGGQAKMMLEKLSNFCTDEQQIYSKKHSKKHFTLQQETMKVCLKVGE
jgi:hypothetical protein